MLDEVLGRASGPSARPGCRNPRWRSELKRAAGGERDPVRLRAAALLVRYNGRISSRFSSTTKVLFDAGEPIDAVYFPTGAIVSLVVGLSTGEMIEAAMVGRDGVVGAAAALDGKNALSRAIVQLGGNAFTVRRRRAQGYRPAKPVDTFRSDPRTSRPFTHKRSDPQLASRPTRLRHGSADGCCGRANWPAAIRCTSPRSFSPRCSACEGRASPSVTHTLQQAGMIRYTRGKIQIVNLDGLQETACECYGASKSQYQALLGRGGGQTGGYHRRNLLCRVHVLVLWKTGFAMCRRCGASYPQAVLRKSVLS